MPVRLSVNIDHVATLRQARGVHDPEPVAAALLAQNPHPTDKDIDEAMVGNICRCATYYRIRAAIHRAGELTDSGKEARP